MNLLLKALVSILNLVFLQKKKVFFFYIFFILILLPLSAKVKFLVEIEEIIDKSFVSYTQDLKSFIGEKNIYLLLSNEKEKFTNDEICQVSQWWVNEIRNNKDLESSFASFEAAKLSYKNNKFSMKEYVPYSCNTDIAQEGVSFKGLDSSPWSGVLSPKGRDSELLISFSVNSLENRGFFGHFNSSGVDRLIESFETAALFKEGHIKTTWGGLGLYFYYLVRGYIFSMLLNMLSIISVSILLGLFFRSAKTGLLFYILYQLVIFPIFSLMGFLNFNMDTLTNTLPIMVLLACLQDFIFITYYHRKENLKESFKNLILPGFFTSLTTVVGFGSLMAADLPIIRRFGFITGCAAALEFVVMFFIFPSLLSLKFFKNWSPDPILKSTKSFKFRIPYKISLLLVLLPFIFLTQINKLNFVDFPENLFPKSHDVRKGIEVFQNKFEWVSIVNLIYDEKEEEFIKSTVLPKVLENEIVSKVENFSSVVDSLSENMSEMDKLVLEGSLKESGYAQKFIPNEGSKRRSILYINSSKNTEITKLWETVDELCKGRCKFSGDLVSYTEFSNKVVTGFHKSILTSFILVLVLILLVAFVRGEPNKLKLVLSSMWGPLSLLSLFLIFDIPIFFVTSIVVSIVMGLTGDNALFFLLSDKNKKASQQASAIGVISVVVAFAYLFTISFLLFSYFGALRLLALLMIAGLMFSIFGDLVLFLSLDKEKKS